MGSALQVFPVRLSLDTVSGKWSKHPAVPKGRDWREYRASAAELAHANNVGIVIPDGVIVIDIDTRKGVMLTDVEVALGCSLDWDAALLQRTVSGGAHYAFAIESGLVLKQGSNLMGVSGFDTRCAGRGWICTGTNYTDATLTGLPEALGLEAWPTLPALAVAALSDASTRCVSHGDGSDMLALESALAAVVMEDMTLLLAAEYLTKLPIDTVDQHDPWLRVGMGLHHQFTGSAAAFSIWHDWSRSAKTYDEAELISRWGSFARRSMARPVTFAAVIAMAGGRKVAASGVFERLLVQARAVSSMVEYEALKSDARSVAPDILTGDLRGILAAEISKGFGREAGLSKTEIKGALSAPRRGSRAGDREVPSWANDWVFVEVTCQFAHTGLNYSVRREAFNAKHDRESECAAAEKPASQLCLVDYRMPTVVDTMFWPGVDDVFEVDGRRMLNTYRPSGAARTSIDADGQAAIDLFLRHVAFTLEDPREREILLDWMCFVIQNPGQRVNWALLLQGSQGTGKSFFVHVMQLVLGGLVRNLDPAAIAGRFTGWAHGALMVAVEEIRISGTNRYEVLDRLKPFLTNPTIQIEEKNRDHRTVPNFTSYFMLTNHKDAIPLTSGDRRYCVLFSRVQSEEQLFAELGGPVGVADYFSALFSTMEEKTGAIAEWFYTRKISKNFDAKGRAPATAARAVMTAVAISPDKSSVEDALSRHECGVIGGDLVDVTWLSDLCLADGTALPNTRALSAILLELGYEQVEGRKIKVSKTRKNHYVWTRNLSLDDARIRLRDFNENDSVVTPQSVFGAQ